MTQTFRRRAGAGLAVVVLALGLAARASDVLTQFKVSRPDAESAVLNAVWNGSAQPPGGAAVFKALGDEGRVAAVKAAAAFAKAYTRTDAFRQAYAAHRDGGRPVAPEAPRAWDDEMAEQREAMKKSVAEMREGMKQMTPEMRKQMEATIEMMEQQMEAQASNREQSAQMDKMLKEGHQQALQEHASRVSEYEANYPADPDRLIAQRLKAFLDGSADVPAKAELVEKNGKLRFVDPALEQKPAEWKMLYRAGKPATDAVRAEASAWLAELGGK